MQQHTIISADKHISDWMPLSYAESLGCADADLNYWTLEPAGGRQHGNGRAVFYLHGLGGHPLEQEGLCHWLSSQGFTVFALEQPGTKILYSLAQNKLKAAAWLAAFDAGTLLKCFWNGQRQVDQLARWWGFEKVDVVGVSYGGIVASLFAAHSPVAHRILCLVSSLDIPDIIRNFPELMNDARLKLLANALTFTKRWQAQGMEWNRGPFADLYRSISPWRAPANPGAQLTFLNNEGDPIMRADPLREAVRLAAASGLSNLKVQFLQPSGGYHGVCLDEIGGAEGACRRCLME